jgi:MarR family transcriptional regulator for hemolysin
MQGVTAGAWLHSGKCRNNKLAYNKPALYIIVMAQTTPERELAFIIKDVARMIGTLADQRARQFGVSRAQWAVLARLDRSEGLKQHELAEMLDLQPITLTRLLDRLAENGLIERRADPNDRRANRLYLMPAARPLLDRLAELGTEMMKTVLDGIDRKTVERMLLDLDTVKDNLRAAIGRNPAQVANG